MRRSKKNKIFFMFFLMQIWLLTGCNSISSVDESIDFEEQAEEDSKEETESLVLGDIAECELPEDMLAYWLVLNSEQPFISTDEGYQKFYWKEYFWCLGRPVGRHQADYFMIVDMNGDGANEIVLGCSPESTQVLHYEDGEVYSYQFVYRGMMQIYNNGIYEGSDGAASTFYCRLTELNKDGYKEEILAFMDDDYYEVAGKAATYGEFCDYLEFKESVAPTDCMKFTEEMLEKILLGDLEEKELYIIKHAEPKEICDANNPQKANVPEVYLPVLTGKEELICVTEEGQKYLVDGNCIRNPKGEEAHQVLYFSMADMEGDGEEEVVLTCDGETVILHAAEDTIYGYVFDFWDEMGVIARDGVFRLGYVDENKYGKIVSFETDGCLIEPVKDYESNSQKRIRYYFFSEEVIAQWSEQALEN